VDTAALVEDERQAHADALIAQAEYSQTVRGPSAVEVNAARADLVSAQAAYADLQKPPSENEVANLRATMLNAEAALKRAQAAYDSAFAFDPAGIGASPAALDLEKTTNDFNAAKANYDKAFEQTSDGKLRAASAQIASARAKLAGLQPAAEKVDAAKARLDKAVLTWEKTQADVAKAELIAPMDGVVIETKVREGEMLRAGDPVLVLSDPRAVEVKASVIEEDLPLVRVGQEVSVFFDAAPDAPVTGKVARISPKRIEGDRPLYPIYIELKGAELPQGLAPGMSADASVIINKVADALRLPRAVVKAGSAGTAKVEVWANGQRELRTVKVGLRGDTYVEILDGLREGEEVVGE
jgi:HlyD family secretion protein